MTRLLLLAALICAAWPAYGRPKTGHPGNLHFLQITPRHQIDRRPRAWCGWYARHHLVSHDPGKAFNRARRWARYGRPAHGPHVGTIVVWRHHVGKIVGRSRKGWVVRSGNDGHRVRTRVRSVRGAIAFRWPYD